MLARFRFWVTMHYGTVQKENECKEDLIWGIFGILRNEPSFVFTAVPLSNRMPSKDHEKVLSRIIYFFRVMEKD